MDKLDLDALQRTLDELREEKATMQRERALLETTKAVTQEHLSRLADRVKLNVGGVRFETTRSTLCRYPDSMLGTMFSGREGIEVATDEDGHVFIDRPGAQFGRILDFLRTGTLRRPTSRDDREALQAELDFYLLDSYVPAMKRASEESMVPTLEVVTTKKKHAQNLRQADEDYQAFFQRHAQAVQAALKQNPTLRIVWQHNFKEEHMLICMLSTAGSED